MALTILSALLAGCASTGGAERVNQKSQEVIATQRALRYRTTARRPVEPYRVGPRDELTVRIADLEKPGSVSTVVVRVDEDGTINLPLAGTLEAAGKTTSQIRQTVAEKLRGRLLIDPNVAVEVTVYQSRKVTVLGAVKSPGSLLLERSCMGVAEALAGAGGLTEDAGMYAYVHRELPDGTAERRPVDLVALLIHGNPRAERWLRDGDRLEVPKGREFFVAGYVAKPGPYRYNRPLTLLQAVGLAGGLRPYEASPSAVTVSRTTQDGTWAVEVDLERIAAGKTADLPIYPGDTIVCGRTWRWAIYQELKGFLSSAYWWIPGAAR